MMIEISVHFSGLSALLPAKSTSSAETSSAALAGAGISFGRRSRSFLEFTAQESVQRLPHGICVGNSLIHSDVAIAQGIQGIYANDTGQDGMCSFIGDLPGCGNTGPFATGGR
jgi:hypothetical protein